MRIEKSTRPSRLLRVREFADKRSRQPAETPEKPAKSRFVGPYYLGTDEQQSILDLLGQTGIGDVEGRQLFLTAMEYEVGVYRLNPDPPIEIAPEPTLPEPVRTSAADSELAALSETADALLDRLQSLQEHTRSQLASTLQDSDPFARIYDARYLRQLEIEIARLRDAAEPTIAEPAPAPSPEPVIGEAARKLIAQIRRIFGECLDVEISPSNVNVLCGILAVIRDSAGIALPTDEDTLCRLLPDVGS